MDGVARRTSRSFLMKYVFAATLVLAGMTHAADDAASKKVLQEIEGVYTLASAERAGSAPPGNFIEDVQKVTIKDGKLIVNFKVDDKLEEKSAAITIDATQKPIQINMVPDKDKTVPGILQLDGDTLKICWNDTPSGKRPAGFTTSKEDKNFMLVLKREKK